MSKDMNVTLWPIWDAGDGTLYADKHDRTHPTNVGYEMYCRRFRNGELAAEYWHAACNRSVRVYDATRDIPGVTWEWEHMVIERFALLPDAAEADYE